MTAVFKTRPNSITAYIYNTNGKVTPESHCRITTDRNKKRFIITDWQTAAESRHKGFGKRALRSAIKQAIRTKGHPDSIGYVWNGQNSYVFDWLEKNFDARCTCPIAVLKNNADDDPESHIYELDVAKVLDYFNLKNTRQTAGGPRRFVIQMTVPEKEDNS